MTLLAHVVAALVEQLGRARSVAGLGLLGVGLGGACAAVGLAGGFEVPPEGDLWETAIFDGAVGVFVLTQAALLPEAGFGESGRRRWAAALGVSTLYAYAIETVQAFRGLDPRFSAVAGPADRLLGGLFFLDALLLMALFLILAWPFFRRSGDPLRLAVRYAAVACAISFGVGIWMSTLGSGRFVGGAGNLLPIHAAGFHGLQALPLVALLFLWGNAAGPARLWIHVAGVAWLGLCAALLWQAVSGRAPLELSGATAVAWLSFGVWLSVAAHAVGTWRRGRVRAVPARRSAA